MDAKARVREILEHFSALVEDGDWETAAALYAEDAVWEDRRPGLGVTVTGSSELRKLAQAIVSVGVRRMTYTLVDVRGHNLALLRVVTDSGRDDAGFEVEQLILVELNSEDLITRTTMFRVEDVDVATQELELRWRQTSGESH